MSLFKAVLANYEHEFQSTLKVLRAIPEDKLNFTPHGETWMELPRIVYLQSALLSHTIHHRGQLTVLLRVMGAKVPGVYGPSADEAL